MRRFGIVTLAIAFCGCATARPHVLTADRQIAPGVYEVTVDGRGRAEPAILRTYAEKRASELCATEGFQHLRIVDGRDALEQSQIPASYIFNGANMQAIGGGTVNRHQFTVRAVCLTDSEFTDWQTAQWELREKLAKQPPSGNGE